MIDDKSLDELQRLIEDAKTQRYFCTRCGKPCDRPICCCDYMALELPTPKWINPATALCEEVKSLRAVAEAARELKSMNRIKQALAALDAEAKI